MTTYYVRLSGDDGNNGTHPSTAWRTVAHAASRVAAGDTVYIGGGVFREAVDVVASGSAAQPIRFIGDYTGQHCGDPGWTLITPQSNDGSTAADLASAPAHALRLNDVHHVEFSRLQIGYGASHAVSAEGGGQNCEGVVFDDCTFLGTRAWHAGLSALHMTYTLPTKTAAGPGLTLRNCTLYGAIRLVYDESAVTPANLKVTIAHCLFWVGDVRGQGAVGIARRTPGAYAVGGFTVHNCLMIGGPGPLVYLDQPASASAAYRVYNNVLVAVDGAPLQVQDPVGAPLIEADFNVPVQADAGAGVRGYQCGGHPLIGGLADFTLRRFWGWSPWRPWEPIHLPYLPANTLATAHTAYNLAADRYATPRLTGPGTVISQGGTAVTPQGGWIGAETLTGTDLDDYAWTDSSDAHLVISHPRDIDHIAADADITSVTLRGRYRFDTVNSSLRFTACTDGQTVADVTLTPAATAVQDWMETLDTPTGGWSKTRLQNLTVDLWRSAGNGRLYLYAVLIYVNLRRMGGSGPVYAHRLAEPETAVRVGNSGAAIKLAGAGSHSLWRRLFAATYQIQVSVRRNSAYSGPAPSLEVTDLRSGDVWTAALSAPANTWQVVSVVAEIPGYDPVRVRFISADTSRDGACYWDNFQIAVIP